jgi:hypothetical protein
MFGSCCPTTPAAGSCAAPIRTTFAPITVGQNLYTQYHKLLFPEGFEEYVEYNDCDSCSWATDFSVTYRYMQTRNSAQIANALWGGNTLLFQGSGVQDRSNNALIAEYFGMGPDTNGSISLCPRLRNQVIDFQLAISGAKFWAQVNLPAVYSKWSVTTQCGAPTFSGIYDNSNLDGAIVELNYPAAGGTSVAGSNLITGTPLYDGGALATPTNSFVGALNNAALINVDTENNDISSYSVSLNGAAAANTLVGFVNMGLYGAFDNGGMTENVGATSATFSTADVAAASDFVSALGGYTFGMVQNRNLNLFNFNPCGVWGLADIPVMLGYDFCKSDVSHLGMYLKFVIPTGTKINSCFLQYVLTPVIGNGRHFELGVGVTGHANVWSCDTSSFSIYGDGYIDYMFGACQTRTFDLPGQPMSRYALVYPLSGNNTDGYSVGNTMVAVGDVNLYQGNVTATRGEFMFDLVWATRNWEVGMGYAFTGQSAEKINCGSCDSLSSGTGYALVGNTLQQTFGLGPVNNANWETAIFSNAPYNPTTPAAFNFFYLGTTGEAAEVASGENSAYNYGTPGALDSVALNLPNVQGNCSGLMSGQVLNKIFGHIDYVWVDCAWQPEIGILGSIGFVPNGKPTANYWDLGARVGFAF